MTIEQLLLLAVFVLASLLNLVVQALRRRRQQAEQAEQSARPGEEDADLRPQPAPPLPPSAVYRDTPAPAPVPAAPRPVRAPAPAEMVEPPPPPSRQRRRPRVTFRTASDVRRAFVLMTVLGPCRALERRGDDRVDQPPAAAGGVRG